MRKGHEAKEKIKKKFNVNFRDIEEDIFNRLRENPLITWLRK